MNEEPAPLKTTSQVARRLGVKEETVCGLVRAGKLEAVLIGREYRYEPAWIEAYIASCRKRKPGARRHKAPP